MRRFITAIALTVTAFTSAACDVDQTILDNVKAKTPHSDFHSDLPITNGCGTLVCKNAH